MYRMCGKTGPFGWCPNCDHINAAKQIQVEVTEPINFCIFTANLIALHYFSVLLSEQSLYMYGYLSRFEVFSSSGHSD